MNRLTKAVLGTVAVAALSVGITVPAFANTADPRQMSYVVVPHPDDELETWSG